MTMKQIQHLLAYLGYDVEPDGIPGPQTTTAVRAFQTHYGGITVDGDPGRDTQKALRDAVAYNKLKPPDKATDTHTTGTFWDEIQYFSREEFRCKCGGTYCDGFPAEPQEILIRAAEKVRRHFGAPVTVSSGLRCPQHNAAQKGSVPNSKHLSGSAMDFIVRGISAEMVLPYVQRLSGIQYAYAIDRDYVHMDVG